MAAAIDIAKQARLRRLWLVITDDKLDALRFYQRRDLRIVESHPGALDTARALKPTIPGS